LFQSGVSVAVVGRAARRAGDGRVQHHPGPRPSRLWRSAAARRRAMRLCCAGTPDHRVAIRRPPTLPTQHPSACARDDVDSNRSATALAFLTFNLFMTFYLFVLAGHRGTALGNGCGTTLKPSAGPIKAPVPADFFNHGAHAGGLEPFWGRGPLQPRPAGAPSGAGSSRHCPRDASRHRIRSHRFRFSDFVTRPR